MADDEEACKFALQLAYSGVLPMALRTAIELGLVEILVGAHGESLTPEEIAAKMPSKANNPEAPSMVDRMLRLLASHKVVSCAVEEAEDGILLRRYAAEPVCRWLAPNKDGVSMAPCALYAQSHVFMETWCHMKDAVLEGGGSPFHRAFGTSWIEYAQKHASFMDIGMQSMKQHSVIITKKILELYRGGFDGISTLLDVGGGTGAVIHAITSMYPNIKGINFDLPHVIADAPDYPDAHVQHIGGNMFQKVPSGADAILMKWVFAAFSDQDCTTVLKNCYDALPAHGKIINFECIMPMKPEAENGAKAVIAIDVSMLTLGQGMQRHHRDFEKLAKGAGFAGFKTTYVYADFWAMEYTK